MSDKLKPETEGFTAERASTRYTKDLRALIEKPQFEQKHLEGFYKTETHSRVGEHVVLYYNSHRNSDLPGDFFLQTYPPGHTKLRRDEQLDDFRWTELVGPDQIYPDKLDRIDSLLALFDTPNPKEADG